MDPASSFDAILRQWGAPGAILILTLLAIVGLWKTLQKIQEARITELLMVKDVMAASTAAMVALEASIRERTAVMASTDRENDEWQKQHDRRLGDIERALDTLLDRRPR